jgi:hypothetical protein
LTPQLRIRPTEIVAEEADHTIIEHHHHAFANGSLVNTDGPVVLGGPSLGAYRTGL